MAQLRHFEKYCILANQPNNMSSVAHSHIWCNIAFPRIAHLALARNVVQFNDTLYLICFLNRKLAPPVWKYKSTKFPYVAKIHSVMQKTSGPLANDQSMSNFEKRQRYEILRAGDRLWSCCNWSIHSFSRPIRSLHFCYERINFQLRTNILTRLDCWICAGVNAVLC